jgi:hypothetical protein
VWEKAILTAVTGCALKERISVVEVISDSISDTSLALNVIDTEEKEERWRNQHKWRTSGK